MRDVTVKVANMDNNVTVHGYTDKNYTTENKTTEVKVENTTVIHKSLTRQDCVIQSFSEMNCFNL